MKYQLWEYVHMNIYVGHGLKRCASPWVKGSLLRIPSVTDSFSVKQLLEIVFPEGQQVWVFLKNLFSSQLLAKGRW